MHEVPFTTIVRTSMSEQQMFDYGDYAARRFMERELRGQDVQGWLVELGDENTDPEDPWYRKIKITFDVEDRDDADSGES